MSITATGSGVEHAIAAAARYPRLRYMGSKYRLVPHLTELFAEIGGRTALDAFSGSGVVSYALKSMGYAVTSSDFLSFPSIIAGATVANQHTMLADDDIAAITGPPADDRDFIQTTFAGLYFTPEDLMFLDAAWSHIDRLEGRQAAASHRRPRARCSSEAAERGLHVHRPSVRRWAARPQVVPA
jgi:DNA adenine methylase/adenine-specific DNA-methyltransferase